MQFTTNTIGYLHSMYSGLFIDEGKFITWGLSAAKDISSLMVAKGQPCTNLHGQQSIHQNTSAPLLQIVLLMSSDIQGLKTESLEDKRA